MQCERSSPVSVKDGRKRGYMGGWRGRPAGAPGRRRLRKVKHGEEEGQGAHCEKQNRKNGYKRPAPGPCQGRCSQEGAAGCSATPCAQLAQASCIGIFAVGQEASGLRQPASALQAGLLARDQLVCVRGGGACSRQQGEPGAERRSLGLAASPGASPGRRGAMGARAQRPRQHGQGCRRGRSRVWFHRLAWQLSTSRANCAWTCWQRATSAPQASKLSCARGGGRGAKRGKTLRMCMGSGPARRRRCMLSRQRLAPLRLQQARLLHLPIRLASLQLLPHGVCRGQMAACVG